MSEETHTHRSHGFLIGLGLGTVMGAGLAVLLVPRAAAELRERAVDSARDLGNRASEGYQEVSARIGEAVDELAKHGRTEPSPSIHAART